MSYNYELETGRNLLKEEMIQLSEAYSDYMKLNSNVKRMDSLMIASRCKRMSRLEIIYSTTANAVRLIHGNEELLHYLDPDDYNNVIYYRVFCVGKRNSYKRYRSSQKRDCQGIKLQHQPGRISEGISDRW